MSRQLPVIQTGIQPSDDIRRFTRSEVASGRWREQIVPAAVLGTPRDMMIYRAARKSSPVKHTWHGSRETFCPPKWFDLGIGSGACGYGCRFCFLMLTFRAMRDPMSPVVYDNLDDFDSAVRRWLTAKDWKSEQRNREGKRIRVRRTSLDTLGLGIDCSDSLLFEGVTGHARRLIPLFGNPATNAGGNKLILLTKSANTHYLDEAPVTDRVAVTFSLNPERMADLWEGKYPDGLRITPSIEARLDACLHAQRLGHETRWRIDPILTPEGWERDYREFFDQAAAMGLAPRYITLGTYRQKNAQLDRWRELWGLPRPEWEPAALEADGTHEHVLAAERLRIYSTVMKMIDAAKWKHGAPRPELCKEPHALRRDVGVRGVNCNCLQ